MKTIKFKLLFISLIFISSNFILSAKEVTKSLHKEFDVNENTVLVLRNKYGKIDIRNSSENKVVIDVKIIVEHPDQETAQKILGYLDVEFSTAGNEVKAITYINDRINKIRGSNWGNNKKFRINYTVTMPKDLDIKLSNKYGDTFIDELTGYSEIDIKYGNLQANKIIRGDTKPLTTLTFGYSNKIEIGEMRWAKIYMKYSTMKIEKSRALVVESKYSNLSVDEASSIVAESKYDNYKIGKTDNFVIQGSYSGYKLEYVGKKLILETKYTGTSVERIPATFEEISITNSYGGVKLGISSGASYQLKGEARYASISVPSEGRLNRIKGNTSSSYEGIVGTNMETKSKVTVRTSYGSVHLDY
jgi:hypothetical protein